MRWYRFPGWPARLLGRSAATPVPHRLAGSGARQYKDGVTGHPGTERNGVPVPPPAALPGSGINGVNVVAQAMGGLSYSRYSPGFWPNLYWARPERDFWPGAGMPVSVFSDNLMPIPATDPRQVAAPLAVPLDSRRVQGFTGGGINQPANLVMWPTVNG